MSDETQANDSGTAASDSREGTIKNMGVLNLLSAKSAEDLSYLKSMKNVGLVLVPESLSGVLARVQMENVGQILPVPDGTNVNPKVFTGQLTLSGQALADPEAIVVIAGQVIITPPVGEVKCKIVAAGQLLVPKEGEAAIQSAFISATGQVLYYRGQEVKTIFNDETFDNDFFEALEHPITLIPFGDITIAADVTSDVFRSKVADIVGFGDIEAPKHLKSLIQARSQLFGDLIVSD